MFNPLQTRTLKVTCDALPLWAGADVLAVQRVSGTEALGELFDYRVELATSDSPLLPVYKARDLIKPDELIGKSIAISIEFEGKGTFIPGMPGNSGAGNIGAGVRSINGLITEVQHTGSDDRRAYYQFTVRPWLWLASQNRDSRVFQNMSVLDVTEAVLKNGNYTFPWTTRLAAVALNNNVFPKRDYIRQFWQSDYEFLSQLWSEWGLYYVFDGMTLVLCDSPGSHKKHHNVYDTVLYQAPEAKRIDEEHIHRLQVTRRITAGDVTLNDYDYTRSNGKFDVNQSRFSQASFDNIEQYHWGDYTQPLAGAMGLSGTPNDYDNEGDYLARVRVEALRCEGLRAYGTGNLRGLTTGKTFVLEGHPQKEINQSYLVVSTSLDVRNADELTIRPGTDAHYHCTTDFVLQPANAFFKLRAQPKPRAHAETAVVVGPENQPLWLDGYARVRVQFKWDRLGQHDQDSSCWVRVSLPWHGGPHSFMAVPRIGDELTIAYHEGDPDKPFVASSKVNQFNAPPFALPKNMALTGLVSHALEGQGHNYVVTDDTPGQQQVQVASDQANSRLVLGANTRIVYSDGRQDRRGEGFELATHSHGVLRANSGMLVTTASRDGASAPAKDMGETLERLAVAHDQQDTFATLAREQMAQESGDQDDVAQALQSQHDEIRGQGTANAPGGVFPELASAHLVLNGEAGLVGVTPASLHLASGEHMALSAGGHVGMSVGKRLLMSVARGVRTLVQSAGWKLVAMSGDIELNALKDNLKLLAKLNISASANEISISAKEKLTISGGGSSTQYTSGGITHMSSGSHTVHSAGFTLTGPMTQAVAFPDAPKPGKGVLDLFHTYASSHGVMSDYKVEDALGRVVTGVLSAKGFASVSGLAPGPAQVTFGTDKADPWAPSSYVHLVEWPEKSVGDAGAVPPAQAASIGSEAMAVAGKAVQSAQMLSQLAGVIKPGVGGSAAKLLGTAGMLLSGTGAMSGVSASHAAQADGRTPSFV